MVRLAKQSLDLRARKSVLGLQRHPERARQVRGGHDARPLHQLGELLAYALEGHPVRAGLQHHYRAHLASDFEYEIVLPLDLLRGMRKRKAVPTNPFDIHERSSLVYPTHSSEAAVGTSSQPCCGTASRGKPFRQSEN